jgi:hypothetical protein
MGHWHEITPHRLAREDTHKWVFAAYSESPNERSDGQWYDSLLFRDVERTVFGIREWIGELVYRQKLRELATKIVTDAEFRSELISSDPELPELWKRR